MGTMEELSMMPNCRNWMVVIMMLEDSKMNDVEFEEEEEEFWKVMAGLMVAIDVDVEIVG